MSKLTLAEGEGISQELVLHPVHLQSSNSKKNPSALVPFCSYQGDSSLLGQKLDNLTICDKFEPTILEGRFCYSLDISKLKKHPTKAGIANGLLLLLDPNPFQLSSIEAEDHSSATIYIETLAQYAAEGRGGHAMSALKRMTGTSSFEELPDEQKKCQIHNREECHTKKYLDQVKSKCGCLPWTLATNQSNNQVKT